MLRGRADRPVAYRWIPHVRSRPARFRDLAAEDERSRDHPLSRRRRAKGRLRGLEALGRTDVAASELHVPPRMRAGRSGHRIGRARGSAGAAGPKRAGHRAHPHALPRNGPSHPARGQFGGWTGREGRLPRRPRRLPRRPRRLPRRPRRLPRRAGSMPRRIGEGPRNPRVACGDRAAARERREGVDRAAQRPHHGGPSANWSSWARVSLRRERVAGWRSGEPLVS